VKTLLIRRATERDHRAICRLAEQMDELHRTHLPERFRRPRGHARQLSYIRKLIRDPQTLLLVAELDGKVVAIANSGLGRTPEIPQKRPRRYVRVRGIVVDSKHRRQGVATSLMREVFAWARRHRCHEIQLNVYDFNSAARRFYSHLGFEPLDTRLVRALR